MTDAQKFRFYFPAWNDCVRANNWRVENKFVVIDNSRLTAEGRVVLTFAQQRATMRDGATPGRPQPVTMDDLRHGAHWLALGRDKSSEHLNNAEVDRVVALFRLLQDPDDLGARMKWDAFQRGEDPGEVKRLDYAITHAAPDGYVRKISEDKFGSRQWEWLTVAQKRQLLVTLKERNKSFRQPLQRTGSQPAGKVYYMKGPF